MKSIKPFVILSTLFLIATPAFADHGHGRFRQFARAFVNSGYNNGSYNHAHEAQHHAFDAHQHARMDALYASPQHAHGAQHHAMEDAHHAEHDEHGY